MRWGLFLLFAVAGVSMAWESPAVPSSEALSSTAALEDALDCIRQQKPIPEAVRRRLVGLPAETIYGRLGKPEVMMDDEWIYVETRSSQFFSFQLKQGRVDSFGYHRWW